jgi:hypothetical protein
VVIKDQKILGYYSDEIDALRTMRGNQPGTFMVKQCRSKGTDIAHYWNSEIQFV